MGEWVSTNSHPGPVPRLLAVPDLPNAPAAVSGRWLSTTAVGRRCQGLMLSQLMMDGQSIIPHRRPSLMAPEHCADTPAHRPDAPDVMAHQIFFKKSLFFIMIPNVRTNFNSFNTRGDTQFLIF